MKHYFKSKITYMFYVLAILLGIYALVQVIIISNDMHEYYHSMGMPLPARDFLHYLIQAGLQPLVWMFMMFGFGYGIDEIRKQNDEYYKTDEELAEEQRAKETAKASKKSKVDYEAITKPELYEMAKSMGLHVTTKTKKADLIEAIKAAK